MSSLKDISYTDIEQIIDALPETFSIADIKKKLGNRSDGLARRLERILDGDDRFFNAPGKDFHRREAFFKGYRFAVTFDSWEKSQGYLIPGHRFVPFIADTVFPSEVTLLDNGVPVPRREITRPLGQAFHYHMLLGSDNIFDFLLAESPANAGIRSHRTANEQVTLTVYDMTKFYAEHKAEDGDAVICEVADYSKGIINISLQSGDSRSVSARKNWVENFDNALTKVCERFEDYLDINEQLTWGLFYGGKELTNPACSLDEYIHLSLKITIRADGDHAVLALINDYKDSSDDEHDSELAKIVSLSRGETGSLAGILKDMGNPVTLPEIDAYILDECFARESDFDAIFRRIFGSAENICVDETQQAYLYNYLEERFEDLHENYNRADDELDSDAMHRLAEIDLRLDEMLKLLNSGKYTPDQTEIEKITDMVESRLDEQQDLLDKLTDSIKPR